MRLVFDVQSLQSPSRYRGIGRYTRCLLKALDSHLTGHEVVLLVNAGFEDIMGEVVGELAELLPSAKCLAFSVPLPAAWCDAKNIPRNQVAELLRAGFIAELEPDLVHVFSLVEGYLDSVVTSIVDHSSNYAVTATFYDLIPKLNPAEYLDGDPVFKRYYEAKLNDFVAADGLLAISEFSAAEARENLDYPPDRIGVASLGPMQNHAVTASKTEVPSWLATKGLATGFALYVGAGDRRKNLPRLVEAWCLLPPELQDRHPLVLAGSMPPDVIASLRHISAKKSAKPENFLVLGQVSDQQLEDLYHHCRVFVFPSWHEGFGLPPLEAMAAGCAVIGANTSSLPEVIGLSEAQFDPFSVGSIAEHLERALVDDEFHARLTAHAPVQAAKFSWAKTAKDTMAFWLDVAARRGSAADRPSVPAQTWQQWMEGYQTRLQQRVKAIAEIVVKVADKDEREQLMRQTAQSLALNEASIFAHKGQELAAVSPWRIEGPFDSSYSLALVNREFARGLQANAVEVFLHSTEGLGDFDPDAGFLAANADLAAMHRAAAAYPASAAVTTRLLYPPRVNDIHGAFGGLHLYGWEEGELPAEWVGEFNTHLQGISTMSHFVSKVLIDNGVSVPIATVGLGIDHWERIEADKAYRLPDEAHGFLFLHVSSCFPRKGVDVLLQAWGDAFTAEDDVTLIIKTFPNPHNEIHRWLAEASSANDAYPNVVIIEQDLSDAEIKSLMNRCQVLVGPSRGEGFGLPFAEAMLSGLAVVTTGYGGQMDFCSHDSAWLVDYSFARAKTHFELSDSVWVEPCCEDLTRQLRAVYKATPEERSSRAKCGREFLLREFTWSSVGKRAIASAKLWQTRQALVKSRVKPKLAWISTWNTPCGIASYSMRLVDQISLPLTVYANRRNWEEERIAAAQEPDGPNVVRCWHAGSGEDLSELQARLLQDGVEVAFIQFNYGFFEFSALANTIDTMKNAGVSVVLMMHATVDPETMPERALSRIAQQLKRCDRLLVHGPGDLNRLKDLGLIDNVALVPHGIIEWPGADMRCVNAPRPLLKKKEAKDSKPILLMSFGFFLPHKGLSELVDTMAMLRAAGYHVRLKMLNAEYPAAVSQTAIAETREKIERLGLTDVIDVDTGYRSDEQCLTELAKADLILFPYQTTGESSSAAVRHALASGAPVAVTPLEIFEDVNAAVNRLTGCAPDEMAASVVALLNNQGLEEVIKVGTKAQYWRQHHYHRVVAERLSGLAAAAHKANSAKW